jgi:hypothetical protein
LPALWAKFVAIQHADLENMHVKYSLLVPLVRTTRSQRGRADDVDDGNDASEHEYLVPATLRAHGEEDDTDEGDDRGLGFRV